MIKNDSTSRLEILFWLLPCFLIILSCPTVSAQQTSRTLIKAQTIYTVDGTILSPGQVLIQDGRIAFVGSSIELSLPAEEVEVDTLIPGIVNAFSHAGLTGVGAEISREVTPEFDTASTIEW